MDDNGGDIIGRLEVVGGWIVGIGGVVCAMWRRVAVLVRACRAAVNLHAKLGDWPGDTISAALRRGNVADAELRIRQATLEAFAGLGAYNCDASGRCTWVNDELAEMFGIDAADMLGFGWTAAIDQVDRMRVVEEWRQAVELGLPYSTRYRVINQRSGLAFECDTWTRSVEVIDRDDAGSPGVVLYYVGAVVRSGAAVATGGKYRRDQMAIESPGDESAGANQVE